MTMILGGTNPAVTFPDGTIQNSANNNFAGPAFSAYQATQQTGVANGVTTKINFDTEIFDTANCFASNRFTPTVAGYYQINSGAGLQNASSAVMCQLTLYKNGGAIANGAASRGVDGVLFPQSTGSFLVYMNGSSDYLEVYIYCSGGNIVAQLNSTFFNGSLVRVA